MTIKRMTNNLDTNNLDTSTKKPDCLTCGRTTRQDKITKEGSYLLSHIALQYHRRNRA